MCRELGGELRTTISKSDNAYLACDQRQTCASTVGHVRVCRRATTRMLHARTASASPVVVAIGYDNGGGFNLGGGVEGGAESVDQ